MSVYLCHVDPERLSFDARVVDRRPGLVRLERSWLHPGGGGQPADRAVLEDAHGAHAVRGVETIDGAHWLAFDDPTTAVLGDDVHVAIDAQHRATIAQLHTDTHILNALVFQAFSGALVTGAKIAADGTAHMDFDLPDVDVDKLRALESEINDVIRAGLEVRTRYVGVDEAARTPGLVRNLSVAPPPTDDGRLRVVEIVGLDVQACGGTHLTSTAESPPIRIMKIDNKGRRNRRVRIALAP